MDSRPAEPASLFLAFFAAILRASNNLWQTIRIPSFLSAEHTLPAARLIPINIEEEMRRSYLDYSMSVIIGRALPDARDGLKPVHRRVLYAMSEMGLQYNKKYTKCAKVVGQAMGVYHPHGDSAIYDTLVRMAQPFSLRYPLVDGQGNFGSVDGDPPAAMRYTECRMERITSETLADIDMETVDFVPNYDESTVEPTVLPTRIPTLIVNGSNGIAVGMATNIPPHNLTEVLNATIALVKNPKAGLAEVFKYVQGPDFPTGGILYGRTGIVDAYRTGRGRFLMRARVAIENVTKDLKALIVTELPYQVNKATLFKRIAELVENKVISDIDIGSDRTRDESDRDGMRMVIGLKRGAQPEIVLNQLYKHTQLQESFSMIFLAVVNSQPASSALPKPSRSSSITVSTSSSAAPSYLLRKAREREHILEGYKIALDNLDTVIKIIRASNSRADARENLYAWGKGKDIVIKLDREIQRSEERGLTLIQIDAILELQLYRLTQLSIDEILKELSEIEKKSPSTKRSSPARKSFAPSSSRSSKTSATGTVTSAAPKSSTKAPRFSLKTSSPTSRLPSPSAIRATSSAPPSLSTASSAAAVQAEWA